MIMSLENIGIDSVKQNKHEKLKHYYVKDIDDLEFRQSSVLILLQYFDKSFADRDYRSRGTRNEITQT